MEDELNFDEQEYIQEEELYTEKAITVSAALGGPFAALYFITKNFKAFGKDKEADNTLLIGITLILIVLVISVKLPDFFWDATYTKFFQFLWAIPVFFIVRKFQNDDIKKCLELGFKKSPAWKVFVYSLLSLAANIIVLVGLTYLIQEKVKVEIPTIDKVTSVQMEYSGCKVYYDSTGITSNDAKVVGSYMEQIGYFTPNSKDISAILSRDKNEYMVSFVVSPKLLKNTQMQELLKKIIKDIENLYQNRQYKFRMIGIDSLGVQGEKIIESMTDSSQVVPNNK